MNVRKKIPVIIPFYKNKNQLDKCIEKLNSQENVVTEIFIRDNSDDNILYTKAVNEGLKKFVYSDDYDYVLVLTQDVYLDRHALDKLASALEDNMAIGIAAPIQIGPQQQITWAGSLSAFPWGVHNMAEPQYTAPFKTFWANGACMLLRVSMVREIGLFDENMLFIFSDCDYSFTARLRSWDVMVVPEAKCEHYLKASISNDKPELNAVKMADQLFFTAKWINGIAFQSLDYEGQLLGPSTVQKVFSKNVRALNQAKHYFLNFKKPTLTHSIFSILDRVLKATHL